MDDPLLAELEGLPGAPTITRPDARETPAPPEPDPLRVVEAEAPPVQSIQSKKGTASRPGYRVVVEGDYYVRASDGKHRRAKPYSLSFNLPTAENALGLIVQKLLNAALLKHDPESLGYHTHEIRSVTPLTQDTAPTNNLQYMERPALEAFARSAGAPIDLKAYFETEDLRAAIIDWRLNPKGFEAREAVRQEDRRVTRDLLSMNPTLIPAPVETVDA